MKLCGEMGVLIYAAYQEANGCAVPSCSVGQTDKPLRMRVGTADEIATPTFDSLPRHPFWNKLRQPLCGNLDCVLFDLLHSCSIS